MKMSKYQVFIMDTDSCFFDDYAPSESVAIDWAIDNYSEKYPEEPEEAVEAISWSVIEIDD
jgi:hypothetical protein